MSKALLLALTISVLTPLSSAQAFGPSSAYDLPEGSYGYGIAMQPVTGSIYVADFLLGRIYEFDPFVRKEVARIAAIPATDPDKVMQPVDVIFNSTGSVMYVTYLSGVADAIAGLVVAYKTSSGAGHNTEIDRMTVDAPNQMAIAPNKGHLYVTSQYNYLYAQTLNSDGTFNGAFTRCDTSNILYAATFSSDSKYVFATSFQGGFIAKYTVAPSDPADRCTSTIVAVANPAEVKYSNGILYASSWDGGIALINTESMTLNEYYQVHSSTNSNIITNDGKLLIHTSSIEGNGGIGAVIIGTSDSYQTSDDYQEEWAELSTPAGVYVQDVALSIDESFAFATAGSKVYRVEVPRIKPSVKTANMWVGEEFADTSLQASGFPTGITFTHVAGTGLLPTGVTLNEETGLLEGTPGSVIDGDSDWIWVEAKVTVEGAVYTSYYAVNVITPVPRFITWDKNTTDTVTNLPSGPTKWARETWIDLPPNVPARAGYHFLGWQDKTDGDLLDPGEAYLLLDDVTMRAVWAAEQSQVRFNANTTAATSGIPATVTRARNASYTFPAAPTRSGYTFSYWASNADGSGSAYKSGQTISLTAETLELWAQWTVVTTTTTTRTEIEYVPVEDTSRVVLLQQDISTKQQEITKLRSDIAKTKTELASALDQVSLLQKKASEVDAANIALNEKVLSMSKYLEALSTALTSPAVAKPDSKGRLKLGKPLNLATALAANYSKQTLRITLQSRTATTWTVALTHRTTGKLIRLESQDGTFSIPKLPAGEYALIISGNENGVVKLVKASWLRF